MFHNNRKVFFRVDGGNVYSVGMGHVYRCLKVADLLNTEKKGKSIFVMRDISEGVEKVIENGHSVMRLPESGDEEIEISILEEICKGQILISDIRGISNNYFLRLNNICKKTICFDDLGNNDYSPHYIINPSVTPALQHYKKKHSTTKYLIGERYFILGSSGFKVKSEVSKVIKRVLVSLGGADPANYTPSLLKLLEELPYNFKVTLVLGPAFNNYDEVNDIVRQSNLDIEILVNVKNMGGLMFNHDLAFVAGGDTALELAYTGTPGILVPTIDYENTTAEYLERKEVFVNLGDIQNVPKVEVIKKIDLFWKDYEKRRSFSDNSKRFIDGRGLSRIMAETALC